MLRFDKETLIYGEKDKTKQFVSTERIHTSENEKILGDDTSN